MQYLHLGGAPGLDAVFKMVVAELRIKALCRKLSLHDKGDESPCGQY
jgi:hypothetical protein